MRMTPAMRWVRGHMICVVTACVVVQGMAQAAAHDLQRDFSLRANPNGVWSYGALPAGGGPLTLFSVKGTTPDDGGLPIEYWQIAPLTEPTIFHNGNTVTAMACQGQCVFPPGT